MYAGLGDTGLRGNFWKTKLLITNARSPTGSWRDGLSAADVTLYVYCRSKGKIAVALSEFEIKRIESVVSDSPTAAHPIGAGSGIPYRRTKHRAIRGPAVLGRFFADNGDGHRESHLRQAYRAMEDLLAAGGFEVAPV